MAKSALEGVHVLTITIDDVEPRIWRQLRIPSHVTLAGLHHHIQTAFGWWDYHLHAFEIDGRTYGIDDGEDWGRPTGDEASVTLAEIAPVGTAFTYTYDFGDNWNHTVAVDGVEEDADDELPSCIDGARASPPEDCGGPSGYAHLLEVLGNPGHEDHGDLTEWAGKDFDPESFDTRAVNAAFNAWMRATVHATRQR